MAHTREPLRRLRQRASAGRRQATMRLTTIRQRLTTGRWGDVWAALQHWRRGQWRRGIRLGRIGIELVFVVLLIVVVLNGLIALRSFRLLVGGERLVSQARATEARIAVVETRLLDAENSQRGYLLTGDSSFLASYATARGALKSDLRQLQVLTATNAAQRHRTTALQSLISTKLAQWQLSIDLRKQQRSDAAIAVMTSAASTQTTAAIRALLGELAVTEQQLRDDRLRAADQSLNEAQIAMLVATLANIVFVLAFFLFVRRSLRAREQHLRREQQARATAERAVELRDQFLSLASHELRTPLTSLLTTVTLLERRFQVDVVSDDLQRQSLAVLQRQLGRLDALIATMLDISRIDRGQLGLVWGTVDVVALVRTVAEDVPVTTDTAHPIHVNAPAHGLLVRGDAVRLEQVVQNLLQNAIKYSPEGSPIQVELRHEGEWASLTIADRGMGIPQEVLPKIFDRFYRAPTVRDSEHISGMGIGLSVTREIVALHRGDIAVASTEGFGTTFTVRLPLLTTAAGGEEGIGRAETDPDNARRPS